MKLGQKISLLRQQNNMSQENLAVAMGITRQAVSKWELDEVTPKTATLIKLAKLFNIEVQLLIDNDAEIGLEIQKSPIDKCADNTSKTYERLTEVKQHRDKIVKRTPSRRELIICAVIAFILMVIYILMSTVFKMSVSAYYLYRMGAYIILFILLVILIIEIIKYFRNKNK